MRITVIGTGYVGLVTGTCLANTGNKVVCVDIDENKIRNLQKGIVPIYENQLEGMIKKNTKRKNLHFTTQLEEGIKNAEIIFLALPTPPGEDGAADLQYILEVAKKMSPWLEPNTIVVNKSTVPVGTGEKVKSTLKKHTSVPFDLISNPEFLREGRAVDDFMKPDRVVVGIEDHTNKKKIERLYAPFVRQGNPILFMDIKSAELTKYAANAFLATKITFMNEIATICEKTGANIDHIRKGIGTDTRIGNAFLYAGIGYGGSCFPKDIKALLHTSSQLDYDFKILKSVKKVNEIQKKKLIHSLVKYLGSDLSKVSIAIWGLAFKPNTDDVREAPSLEIIDELLKMKARVRVFDPKALENVKKIYGPKISYFKNEYDTLDHVDALMILTEWLHFLSPDFNEMKKRMKNHLIFDGRNVFEPAEMKELGFEYFCIGKPTFPPQHPDYSV